MRKRGPVGKTEQHGGKAWKHHETPTNWTWQGFFERFLLVGSDRPDHPRMKELLHIEMASPPFLPFRCSWDLSQSSIYISTIFNCFFCGISMVSWQCQIYQGNPVAVFHKFPRFLDHGRLGGDSTEETSDRKVCNGVPQGMYCRWIMEEYASTQRPNMTKLSSFFQPVPTDSWIMWASS